MEGEACPALGLKDVGCSSSGGGEAGGGDGSVVSAGDAMTKTVTMRDGDEDKDDGGDDADEDNEDEG